jgi:hypothetical protein
MKSQALRVPAVLLLFIAAYAADEVTSFPHPQSEEETLQRLSESVMVGETLRFVVVGDTQDDGSTGGGINDNIWPQMATDMNALDPAFALFCGDLVAGSISSSVTINEWNQWKTATSPLSATRLMTPGNHDFYGGTFASWRSSFPWLPTSNSPAGEVGASYYVDVGGTRIISICTDFETGGNVPNQSWLDSVLATSGSFEHVFIFSHRPIQFSTAEWTGGSGGPFWQSMVQNDVRGYFSGHWHRYQPDQIGAGGDTWEVLIGTGGGWQGFEPTRPYQQVPGFFLVEVNGTEVQGTFYGDGDGDGSYDDALDTFVISQAAPMPSGLVAEYNFEGGDAADMAPPPLGRGIDGDLGGNASVGPGLDGALGLHLDGNDFVECGALADYCLSLNNDLSFGLFAEFDSLASGYWDNTLLSYGTGDYYTEDEETNYSYWLNLQSDGRLVSFWEYGDGSNVTLESTAVAPVSAGESHHYALTRDAAAMQVRFYVDGVQLGAPVSFDRLPTSGARGMLYIGAAPVDEQLGLIEWDGVIDSVRIYNQTLSAAEVSALASSCVPRVYCSTSPNSNGSGAHIGSEGTPSLGANALSLTVSAASASKPGIFYYGSNQIQIPFGDGYRCVGAGSTGVFRLPVVFTDSAGDAQQGLDFSVPGALADNIQAGELWNFQFWFRDPMAGGATFNLSDALEITFCN